MSPSISLLTMMVLLTMSNLFLTAQTLHTPNCGSIAGAVAPCVPFLKGKAGKPAPACCSGAGYIAKQAVGKNNRVAICNCLKGGLGKIGPYNANKIPEVGKKCGLTVNIPPVSRGTNCAKVTV